MFLKSLTNKLEFRTRITLMFVLIFGSTTIFFSVFTNYLTTQSLRKDFDDALYNYCIDFSETIEIENDNTLRLPPLKVNESKVFPFLTGETLFAIRYITGEVLAVSSENPGFNPPYNENIHHILLGNDSSYETLTRKAAIQSAIIHKDDTEAYKAYRLITFPLDDDKHPKLFLQIAAPMDNLEYQLTEQRKMLYIGVPIVLLVAILSGLYISSRALTPVKEMIEKTDRINASDLNQRVNIPAHDDVIRKLALTINRMLERIQTAFATQEKFVADASHQLLTPLTILRGEVELKAKHDENKENQSFYKSQLQEIDSLTKIVRSMLLLAQIDSGKNILQLSEVYIADTLLEILPKVQKIADAKKIPIHFNITEHANRNPIQGDEGLLEQMFFNLIENAVKYSPNNSPVNVSVEWMPDRTRVLIEDLGPGVPANIRESVFNRFSRADTSSRIQGHGLGLPIAQKIAELHNTSVQLLDKTTQGSLFVVDFRHDIKNF